MTPADASHGRRGQAGLATLWSLGCIVVLLTIGWVGLALGVGVAAQHHLDGTADLVAVSAAAELQRGRDACSTAKRIADVNRAELADCRIDGDDVIVTVRVVVHLAFGLHPRITAEARAGP